MAHEQGQSQEGYPALGDRPTCASPQEWVIAEATLLRMLKNHYGWVQVTPGEIRKHLRRA